MHVLLGELHRQLAAVAAAAKRPPHLGGASAPLLPPSGAAGGLCGARFFDLVRVLSWVISDQ